MRAYTNCFCSGPANHVSSSVANPREVTRSAAADDLDAALALSRITPEQIDTLRRFAALGPAITADRTRGGSDAPR